MKTKWEDAGRLAKFYDYFGKALQIRGYFFFRGYALAWVRVTARPSSPKEGQDV
jgi:hypothetical protein